MLRRGTKYNKDMDAAGLLVVDGHWPEEDTNDMAGAAVLDYGRLDDGSLAEDLARDGIMTALLLLGR